jgi:hypothetical protein
MRSITTRTIGLVAGIALSVGFAPTAHADDDPGTEPCATQQTQVDQAEAALARVQAVFAHQKQHVREARHALERANTHAERRAARADLALAKEKKEHAAEEKKAQQQRVARATARLDACLAAQSA